MKKNKYKLIINLSMENEQSIYFDRLTKKKLEFILDKTYMLMYFDDFFKKYMPFEYRLSKEQKDYYNNNLHNYIY